MSRQAGQLAGQLASELCRADQWKYSQFGVRSLEKIDQFNQFGIRSRKRKEYNYKKRVLGIEIEIIIDIVILFWILILP